MSVDNKTRQAAFKERMRRSGMKQITIWVNQEQEKSVRALLASDVASQLDVPASPKTKKKTSKSPETKRRNRI